MSALRPLRKGVFFQRWRTHIIIIIRSKNKKSIQSADQILVSAFHYPFKLSIIMICETSNYNMRKYLSSIFQLRKVISAKPFCNKSDIKFALRMRKRSFVLQLNPPCIGTNITTDMIYVNAIDSRKSCLKMLLFKMISL